MHKKLGNMISTITLVLITITAISSAFQIFPEKVYGNPAISNSVNMSPMDLTLGTLPQTVTYWVNVTSIGTATSDNITVIDVQLPTGWTYVGPAVAQAGYGFGAPVTGGLWVNFTTALGTFYNGAIENISIPVSISTVPTDGTWHVYCYQGVTASTSNPVTVTVAVKLQYHSTMTPSYVANDKSYIYTIAVTNDAVPTGIILINITFPAGTWIFNVLLQSSPATWTVHYDNTNTFYLSGPNLFMGDSASITVNMTTPLNATTGEYFWAVRAWNAGAQFLGIYSMKSVVDASTPSISFIAPTAPFYSVGSGNIVWINASMLDTPSIETYFSNYVVTCNDTRFQPSITPWTKTSSTVFVFYFVNVTAIPDGPLAVNITAVDPAGNTGTSTASTTVDNTMPALIFINIVDQASNSLHRDSNGTYWMRDSTTGVSVEAAFYNLQLFTGNIYFNSTSYVFVNSTSSNVSLPDFYTASPYDVTGANLLTVNITLTDGSLPTANRYTATFAIKRDTQPPSAPSFGTTKTICGGVIIPGLTATDNVGIDAFRVYLNGSMFGVTPSELNSDTLTGGYEHVTFNNVTVVELFDAYTAGEVANITIVASDYGGNMGPAATFFITVPAGQWYPLEMYPKWNLISLPLLPNSTVTADIFSLLLAKGASGVNVAYGFDNVAKTWVLNPASMTDGNAYWISMKDYDVLIVQGFPNYAPPGSPPPIVEYDLKQGWNLAGFTETGDMDSWDYVSSLQATPLVQSYFRYAYAWDAENQLWFNIDLVGGSFITTKIFPGQGFWIYTYSDQALIPPVF